MISWAICSLSGTEIMNTLIHSISHKHHDISRKGIEANVGVHPNSSKGPSYCWEAYSYILTQNLTSTKVNNWTTTMHDSRKTQSWIPELNTVESRDNQNHCLDALPQRVFRDTPWTPGTSLEQMDLRGGGVLEVEAPAPMPLLARLLEKHLAV